MAIGAAVAFARENERRFVEESKSLLRMASISADPKHVWHVRRAEFVGEELKPIGMENGHLIETTRPMSKLGYVLNSFLYPTVLLVTALLPASVRAQTASDLHLVSTPRQTFSAVEAAVETQLALLGQSAHTPSRVALSPDGARLAWSLTSADGTVLHSERGCRFETRHHGGTRLCQRRLLEQRAGLVAGWWNACFQCCL